MLALVAVTLAVLHGPDGQKIELNPQHVVTIRDNRDNSGAYFAPGIRCLIHTTDGKVVQVVEDCATVRRLLEGRPL